MAKKTHAVGKSFIARLRGICVPRDTFSQPLTMFTIIQFITVTRACGPISHGAAQCNTWSSPGAQKPNAYGKPIRLEIMVRSGTMPRFEKTRHCAGQLG